MNGKEWFQRWGPWVGPTALIAIMAAAQRVDSYFYNSTVAEMRLRAVESYIEEHKGVAAARISQLDAMDKVQSMDHAMIERVEKDIGEIKMRLARIESRLPVRNGAVGH